MKQKTLPLQSALLEIGVEELPARFVPLAIEQLKTLASNKLLATGISYDSLNVLGTPRRLTLFIQGLPGKAADRTDIAVGPPPAAAKDPQGQWTAAAKGFAKAQGIDVSQLVLENTTKGNRFVAKRVLKGQKTDIVLSELFPELIKEITFPKSMIWEPSGFRFARPIRWIAALYGKRVIRFNLAGVKSDHTTFGLMSMGNQKLTVSSPEKYISLLQNRCILVDPEERKKKIEDQLSLISKKHKWVPVVTNEHLLEVVHITEYPVGILAQFDETYLKLPSEVLISVMRKHQKFFPLETHKKQLVNYFIGIRNGASDSQDIVREGYERVVAARLADARFFFEQDRKLNQDALVERLNEVGFHEKLGSMKAKVERVKELTKVVAEKLQLDSQTTEQAIRAAHLSKFDLLTQMVGEFPELQGIAGRFYAAECEPKAVAIAIEQHLWPLSAAGTLPEGHVSCLVALCDKIDTLTANFSVGLIPSGSADPYGLRRAAIGVIRILLYTKWNISLDFLLRQSQNNLPQDQKAESGIKILHDFMAQRLTSFFESQGYRQDEIDAALSSQTTSVNDLELKLQSLKAIRSKDEFLSLAGAIKRARNILQQAREKGLLPSNSILETPVTSGIHESALLNAIDNIKPSIDQFLKNKEYESALLELAALKKPIDDFFEGVMVMVDDVQVRSQRLSVLFRVQALFDSVIDFSRLQSRATLTDTPSK